MGRLLNLLIALLIILFFVGCGMTLFKSSTFLNEQVGKMKDGAHSITEKASSMGQSIVEIPEKAIDQLTDEEQNENAAEDATTGEEQEDSYEVDDTNDTAITEEEENKKTSSGKVQTGKTTGSEAIAEAKKEIPQAYNTVAKKPTNEAPSNPNTTASTAPYMVITGSFAKAENAASEVNRLKEMGFANAEARYLGSTKYLSVIAQRYFSKADAIATAKRIQATGLEAYVHKRKEKK